MAFHEHHIPTASRDLDSRASPLRRSSSLGDLLKSGPVKRAAAASRPHSKAAGVLATQTMDGSEGALEEAEAAKPAVYSDSGVSRCCVMEVDAINCSDIVLQARQCATAALWTSFTACWVHADEQDGVLCAQVWLGRRVEPKPASGAWDAVADSARPWAVRSPGEDLAGRACAACLAPPSIFYDHFLACADGSTPLNAHCKLVPAKQRVTISHVVDCVGAVSVPDYISRYAVDM